MKICSIEGCENKHEAKGYCHKHYVRYCKYGNPLFSKKIHEYYGLIKIVEYRTWADMKNRCYNKKLRDYHRYGGRGIVVCERWKNSFIAFFVDMGKKPFPKAQIDRIDNNGNYEPENCKWATAAENARNRSNNKLTMEKAEEIRTRYNDENISHCGLATIYGIATCHVARIVNLKCWIE